MPLLGITFFYGYLPRGRQIRGLTLCVGVAPKKNPPTWVAGGVRAFWFRGTHTKSASFKDSAAWLMLCYRLPVVLSAGYPVHQVHAAMPQPALRCCREWLPRGSKPLSYCRQRPGARWPAPLPACGRRHPEQISVQTANTIFDQGQCRPVAKEHCFKGGR